jgi:hypothetical protein
MFESNFFQDGSMPQELKDIMVNGTLEEYAGGILLYKPGGETYPILGFSNSNVAILENTLYYKLLTARDTDGNSLLWTFINFLQNSPNSDSIEEASELISKLLNARVFPEDKDEAGERTPNDLKTILIDAENSKSVIVGDCSSLIKASYKSLPKDCYISIIYLGRVPTTADNLDYDGVDDPNQPQAFCLFPKTIEVPKYAIEIGSNFKVTATGGLSADEGSFNGSLIANSGQLANFTFKDSNLDCPSLSISDKAL